MVKKATAKKSTKATTPTKKATVKKATVKKATVKKATAKKATPKKTKKTKPISASYLSRGLTSKEFHAEVAQKSIKWSESRVSVIKALRKKGATDATKAITADALSKTSGVDIKKIKIHCDAYRGTELIAKGFVKTIKQEGSRALDYFLTTKGVKAKFE